MLSGFSSYQLNERLTEPSKLELQAKGSSKEKISSCSLSRIVTNFLSLFISTWKHYTGKMCLNLYVFRTLKTHTINCNFQLKWPTIFLFITQIMITGAVYHLIKTYFCALLMTFYHSSWFVNWYIFMFTYLWLHLNYSKLAQ